MANEQPGLTEGWMFRVIDPNYRTPRYFVAGNPIEQQARTLVLDHPDVQGDEVEMVGPVSTPDMTVFDLQPGDVKQIDAPYLL